MISLPVPAGPSGPAPGAPGEPARLTEAAGSAGTKGASATAIHQGSSPTVSVLMPVLDEERTVAAAISSVLRQTCTGLEVLVVDGRSTDGTVAVVRQLAQADPRVRLLDNPRRTIPHALNVGLSAARGGYVARVDAHARISDDYLARGVAELEAHPDVAGVGGRRVGVASTPTGLAIAAALSSPYGVGDSINHYAREEQDTDHASFGVYRASVLRAVDGWDPRLPVNEDVDLDHRILAAGHRIRLDPDMVIWWQVRESLRDFGRQYRRYGRGKAAMVRKNGRSAVRVRHLAAPGLLVLLTGAVAAAASGRPRAGATLVMPYAAVVAAGTVRGTVRDRRAARARPPGRVGTFPAALAGALVTMHTSWGLGFLEGTLLRLPPDTSSARPCS